MIPNTSRSAPASQVFLYGLSRSAWVRGTAAGALALTLFEAGILQQKKSFFTGGFLVATHAANFVEGAAFLAGSVLVDASIVGVFAIALLWLTSRLRLTAAARLTLVAVGSIVPLVFWDFVSYSLLAYLGDAFDFGLMFDLTGRNASEIIAVSSAHLAVPAALFAGMLAGVAGVVWTINRFGDRSLRSSAPVSRRLTVSALLLLVVGFVANGIASTSTDLAEDGFRRKASGQLFTRLMESITDFDGDGVGVGGRTSDSAPFNAAIYPYALDVPGNGIDEDGLGGDLPSSESQYEEVAAEAHFRRRPDVVLFVLESFRADAVGRVVNGKPVTPILDAVAAEGVSATRAYSHNGYTTQSRFHLLTGSLAGVRRDSSLVDDFKRNGYQTAYFSAQDESFGGASLGVGFDRADVAYDARQDRDRRYSTFTTAGSLAVSHATLEERIESFLRSRDSSRPLFLYVNFHDTHFPYHHRDIASLVSDKSIPQRQIRPAHRLDVQEMYFNAAANVDRAIGSTLSALAKTLKSPPAVIVTADHGESLFDEGFLGHGYALNDVQTRIPLIAARIPLEISEPFGQVDLRETIVRALTGDNEECRPRLLTAPGKPVFQYLGNIRRPREIGFVGEQGRLIYDFRDGRLRLPDGRGASPKELSPADNAQFLRLVRFWEAMVLARTKAGRGSASE